MRVFVIAAMLSLGWVYGYDFETVVWLQERFVEGSTLEVVRCAIPGEDDSLRGDFLYYTTDDGDLVLVCLVPTEDLPRIEKLLDLEAGVAAMLDGSPFQPVSKGPWESFPSDQGTNHYYGVEFGAMFSMGIYVIGDVVELMFLYE